MTLKWAAIDFPFGGGDAVLAAPGPLEGAAREAVMLRLGDLVDTLGGTYGTGVDLGTTPADMDIVARRTRRVFGRTPENGGAGDPGPLPPSASSRRSGPRRILDSVRPI
jgi:leucine dehydrogenase